jgi:hypothetical protein
MVVYDCYRLLWVDAILSGLKGKTVLTKLDVREAYNQKRWLWKA